MGLAWCTAAVRTSTPLVPTGRPPTITTRFSICTVVHRETTSSRVTSGRSGAPSSHPTDDDELLEPLTGLDQPAALQHLGT